MGLAKPAFTGQAKSLVVDNVIYCYRSAWPQNSPGAAGGEFQGDCELQERKEGRVPKAAPGQGRASGSRPAGR